VLHRSRRCRAHGRAEEDWFGQDERQFLTVLRGIAESGHTPRTRSKLFDGRWRGSVDPVFAEFAY
jgi:glutamate--cysteine ligase